MLQATSYTGKLIGNIDFIEASWNRRWTEPGEFMVYLSLDEYTRLTNLGMKYVSNVGRKETGIIQKTEYSKDASGAFVTVSGYFLEKLLDYGAYRKNQTIDADNSDTDKSNVDTAIKSVIKNGLTAVKVDGTSYKPLGSVSVDSASELPTAVEASIDSDTQMGEALYDLLDESGFGMVASIKSYPTATSGSVGLSLLFKSGVARTKDDSAVYFGEAYNNVDDMSYTLDESAEYCLYEVFQEVDSSVYDDFSESYFDKFTQTEDGEKRYYICCSYLYTKNHPSNIGACYPKKILQTSLSSDECDLTKTTDKNQQKIRKLMRKKAKLDMLNHYKIEEISINVIQERYTYLKDYDLGDTCMVLVDDMLSKPVERRIVECNETHRDNRIEVEIVLGTD